MKLGPCWRNSQGLLRVKGQAQITKCYFLLVDTINMQSISCHYLMRQQVPMVSILRLVYPSVVAYTDFCKNKF